MSKHGMPPVLQVHHNGFTHHFDLHSYDAHTVNVLVHGSVHRSGLEPCGESAAPRTHSFCRTTGRIQSAWGGGLDGALLTPASLRAVHPASFVLAAAVETIEKSLGKPAE